MIKFQSFLSPHFDRPLLHVPPLSFLQDSQQLTLFLQPLRALVAESKVSARVLGKTTLNEASMKESLVRRWLLEGDETAEQVLRVVVSQSGFSKREIRVILERLQLLYYQDQISHTLIQQVTDLLLASLTSPETEDVIILTGSPIVVHKPAATNIQLNKGFSLCFQLYIEQCQRAVLFTIFGDGSGGYQAFLQGNSIYLRTIGPNYTNINKSDSLHLGTLEFRRWHFIAIAHEEYKPFSKSKVFFFVDKNIGISYLSEVVHSSAAPTHIQAFKGVAGFLSKLVIFPRFMGVKIQELNYGFKILEGDSFKDPFFVIEPGLTRAYERTGLQISETLADSRVKSIELHHPLLLLYFSRTIKKSFFQQNHLHKIMQLIKLLLRSVSEQEQAAEMRLFGMVSSCLSQLPSHWITEQVVGRLEQIKRSITVQKLREGFFLQMVWNTDYYRNCASQVSSAIIELGLSYYRDSLKSSLDIFSLSDLLQLAVYKLDTSEHDCCTQHSSRKHSVPKPNLAQTALFRIIYELIQQPIAFTKQFGLICKSLVLDYSPCLRLQILKLLHKLVEHPSTRLQLAEYLGSTHMHLLIVHQIRQSSLLDIFIESTRLILVLEMQQLIKVNMEELIGIINEQLPKFFQKSKIEQPQPEIRPAPSVAKAKRKPLTIDIEGINKLYTTGGEYGRKIQIDDQDVERQLNQIRKLAQYCLGVMRGQLSRGSDKPGNYDSEPQYDNLQPNRDSDALRKLTAPENEIARDYQPKLQRQSFSHVEPQSTGRPLPMPSMRGNRGPSMFLAEPKKRQRSEQKQKQRRQRSQQRRRNPVLSKQADSIFELVRWVLQHKCGSLAVQASEILLQLCKVQKASSSKVLSYMLLSNLNSQIGSKCSVRLIRQLSQLGIEEVSKCFSGGTFNQELFKDVQNLFKMIYSSSSDSNFDERVQAALLLHLDHSSKSVRWFRRAVWNWAVQSFNCSITETRKPLLHYRRILQHSLHLAAGQDLSENAKESWSSQKRMFSQQLPQSLQNYFSSHDPWLDKSMVESTFSIFNKINPKLFSVLKKECSFRDLLSLVQDSKFQQQLVKEGEMGLWHLGGYLPVLTSLLALYLNYMILNAKLKRVEQLQMLSNILKFCVINVDLLKPRSGRNKLDLCQFILGVLVYTNSKGEETTKAKVQDVLMRTLSFLAVAYEHLENKVSRLQNYSDRHRKPILIFQIILSINPQAATFPDTKQIFRHFHDNPVGRLLLTLSPTPLLQQQTTFSNLLQEFLNTIAEQHSKKFRWMLVTSEEHRRIFRNLMKKVWRSYNHPRDQLWKFVKIRVNKHETVQRTRPFIKKKLLDPEHIRKLDNLKVQSVPLSPLLQFFKQDEQFSQDSLFRQGLSFIKGIMPTSSMRQKQQQFSYKKVQWITSLTVRNGNLTIFSDMLVFTYSNLVQKPSHIAIKPHIVKQDRRLVKEWPLQLLKNIFRRRFLGKKNAIQLDLIDGTSLLFNFPHGDNQELAHKLVRLRKSRCPNLMYEHKTLDPRKLIQKDNFTKRWVNREISNFQYLMHLNCLGGRSYKDLSQYPVMPWILSNYSKELNLLDPTHFRDLSKPMGALGDQSRTNIFLQKFQNSDPHKTNWPYHYGTHYSSPGIIYHFLLRLHPFTEGALCFQSGQFDIPDRLFYSVAESYKYATTDPADVRQITPQFFFMPQIFQNLMKLSLGKMQSGYVVDQVELPAWAKTAAQFVSTHRKALQSQQVSAQLSNWIDLIFGYKQKGKQAQKSLNCFHQCTYQDGVNTQTCSFHQKIGLQSQILCFGQCPVQLFSRPHPTRSSRKSKRLCDRDSSLKVFRPTQRTELGINSQLDLNFKNLPEESVVFMKWIDESKLVAIKRGGNFTLYNWMSLSGKIPFQCGIIKQKQLPCFKKKIVGVDLDPTLVARNIPVQVINTGQSLLLGGLLGGKIVQFSLQTDKIMGVYESQRGHTISCLRADKDKENFIISGDVAGNIFTWRINPDQKLSKYRTYFQLDSQIVSISNNKELRCFAAAARSGHIAIFNLITGVLLSRFTHLETIREIVLANSPLSSVCVLGQSPRLSLYTVNGQLIITLQQSSSYIVNLSLQTDSFFSQVIIYFTSKGDTIFRDLPKLQLIKKCSLGKESIGLSSLVTKQENFMLIGCKGGEITVISEQSK